VAALSLSRFSCERCGFTDHGDKFGLKFFFQFLGLIDSDLLFCIQANLDDSILIQRFANFKEESSSDDDEEEKVLEKVVNVHKENNSSSEEEEESSSDEEDDNDTLDEGNMFEHIQSMLENSENGIDAEELAKKLKGKVDSAIIATLLAD